MSAFENWCESRIRDTGEKKGWACGHKGGQVCCYKPEAAASPLPPLEELRKWIVSCPSSYHVNKVQLLAKLDSLAAPEAVPCPEQHVAPLCPECLKCGVERRCMQVDGGRATQGEPGGGER